MADAHQKEATLSNGSGGVAREKKNAEARTRTAEAPRKPRRKEKRGVAWGEVRAGLPQGAVQRLLLIQTQREADKEYQGKCRRDSAEAPRKLRGSSF